MATQSCSKSRNAPGNVFRRVDQMKRRFYKNFPNNTGLKLFNIDHYNKIVDAYTHNTVKATTLYSKFSILEEDGVIHVVERTTNGQPGRKYVPFYPNVFDILYELHTKNDHMSMQNMVAYMKERYVVPTVAADVLLKSCIHCCNRFCAVVEIVNMEQYPDGEFRYILVYEYPSSAFVLLRPLRHLKSMELSYELYKIFLTFKPPIYLKADWKQRAVLEQAMKKLRNSTGCSVDVRATQSQHRLHDKILKGIMDWMRKNSTCNWGIGCHILQLKLNTTKFMCDDPNPYMPQTSVPFDRVYNNATFYDAFPRKEDDENDEEADEEQSENNTLRLSNIIKYENQSDDIVIEETKIQYDDKASDNIIQSEPATSEDIEVDSAILNKDNLLFNETHASTSTNLLSAIKLKCETDTMENVEVINGSCVVLNEDDLTDDVTHASTSVDVLSAANPRSETDAIENLEIINVNCTISNEDKLMDNAIYASTSADFQSAANLTSVKDRIENIEFININCALSNEDELMDDETHASTSVDFLSADNPTSERNTLEVMDEDCAVVNKDNLTNVATDSSTSVDFLNALKPILTKLDIVEGDTLQEILTIDSFDVKNEMESHVVIKDDKKGID